MTVSLCIPAFLESAKKYNAINCTILIAYLICVSNEAYECCCPLSFNAAGQVQESNWWICLQQEKYPENWIDRIMGLAICQNLDSPPE